tara:strand:- start:6037 stop:6405 length:369 start_codon:yes stop_codon:yes gene_type:complete
MGALLTRGLGPSPSLVTSGFGPPPPTTTVETVVQPKGGRRRKTAYETGIESDPRIAIDWYTVTAELMSVNGISDYYFLRNTVKGGVDSSADFKLHQAGKIRIIKTTPISNIFINVSQIYKKK